MVDHQHPALGLGGVHVEDPVEQDLGVRAQAQGEAEGQLAADALGPPDAREELRADPAGHEPAQALDRRGLGMRP